MSEFSCSKPHHNWEFNFPFLGGFAHNWEASVVSEVYKGFSLRELKFNVDGMARGNQSRHGWCAA